VENARGSSSSNREGRPPPVDAGEEGSSCDETSPSGIGGDRGEIVLLPAPTAANENPRIPPNTTEGCGASQRPLAPTGPVHEASVDDTVEAPAATLEVRPKGDAQWPSNPTLLNSVAMVGALLTCVLCPEVKQNFRLFYLRGVCGSDRLHASWRLLQLSLCFSCV
jgi:hypothetical protein